ncbi:MAG TPA: glycosyltransferase [Pyrinomonadaceae bacterium]|nr:glycosyltransferase [Pyrinomonadaceae bacterium]
MARICLITPHHISFQPRTLREADALFEAGHDVRVVCRQMDGALTGYDREIMNSRQWRLQPVDLHRNGPNRYGWMFDSVRSKLFDRLFNMGVKTVSTGARGYLKGFGRLKALAMGEPTDWFIAHTQSTLPIAAMAARRWSAKLGFDCEDLLAEMRTDPSEIVNLLQRRYLPLCDYVSVPSQCLGNRLAEAHKLNNLLVLHNVFPLHFAKDLLPPNNRVAKPVLRLHWFGQTVGEGRGVEEGIQALGLIGNKYENVELHLRGRLNQRSRLTLDNLSRQYRVTNKVIFHAPLPPQDLISSMDHFDVGLALERPDHGNYSLAASNKLLSYLLAGLAVAATDTPGHREVMDQTPAAGFVYPANNPAALAARLSQWVDNRGALLAAQNAAWDAARSKFCWDIEKEKLLAVFQHGQQYAIGTG